MKQVQIPRKLFFMLIRYFICGETECHEQICIGLQMKLDSMINRMLYTKYKTASTEEERETARQEYLERQGIPSEFRW